MSNIWYVNGRIWYSEEIIKQVIELCWKDIEPERPLLNHKQEYKLSPLARRILVLLEIEVE